MPNRILLLSALASSASAWACQGESTERSDPSLVIEREAIGDVEIVTIVSGSVWGAPATVIEELSIGALEGAEEVTFGFITEIVPDAAGGVYVFDSRVPILRYYDADGTFVRNVGGEGSGPGEYGDAALGLAIRSDGRLVMRDARNGRLNVYEPDGEPSESWLVASGLFINRAMSLDERDHVYLKILLGEVTQNKPWPVGLLHLDERGQIVDSIPPPTVEKAPEFRNGRFMPEVVWTMSKCDYGCRLRARTERSALRRSW